MTWYLAETVWQYDGPPRERRQAALLVARFFYQGWIRRSSLASTIWYHARLLVAATVSAVWLGLKALVVRKPSAPRQGLATAVSADAAADSPGETADRVQRTA